MIKLLEKAYNCYITYLDRLNFGRTNQDYGLLYNACLAIDNNISVEQYNQFFINNLLCPTKYILHMDEISNIIAWDLSTKIDETSFIWKETQAPSSGTYTITVGSESGLHFVYFSIPQDVEFKIYNALDMVLHDSTLIETAPGQLFKLAGTTMTSNGSTNNV